MTKPKTHFPQVPVEVAKKVANAESNGNAAELPKQSKKSPIAKRKPMIRPDGDQDL